VAEIDGLVAAARSFEANCDQGRAVPRFAEDGTTRVLDPILVQLQTDCVPEAPMARTQRDLQEQVSGLLTWRGDMSGAFERATQALADGQVTAIISALFAFFIDILVLLCALVGRNVGLPEAVRAIDTIINSLRKPEPHETAFDKRFAISADSNQFELVRPILTTMLSEELIERGESPDPNVDVYLFRHGSLDWLKRERAKAMLGAGDATPAEAPSRAPAARVGRGRF
ncbi:MAG: hypothetical protein AAF914_13985, partial [Pseudomonadota bacterium]